MHLLNNEIGFTIWQPWHLGVDTWNTRSQKSRSSSQTLCSTRTSSWKTPKAAALLETSANSILVVASPSFLCRNTFKYLNPNEVLNSHQNCVCDLVNLAKDLQRHKNPRHKYSDCGTWSWQKNFLLAYCSCIQNQVTWQLGAMMEESEEEIMIWPITQRFVKKQKP